MKLKKAIIPVLILITAYFSGYAQDFHFSNITCNMVYFNPAYASMPGMSEVSLTYRNQWPGMEATFITYGAALVQPIPAISSGTGLVFTNDSEAGGVFSRTSASLIYGYSFDASRTWKIFTGLEASFVLRQFNPDNLVFASDVLNDLGSSYPPAGISAYSKGYPDFGAGLAAKNKNGLMIGFSCYHLTRPSESFNSQGERLPVKYAAHFSYDLPAGGKYNQHRLIISPSVLYIHQGVTDELVWGATAGFEPLVAGAWLRQDFLLHYSALIISAGIMQKKYTFFYNYDVNLSGVNFLSTKMGSHEVTFLLRFEYKRKKFGAVKCP